MEFSKVLRWTILLALLAFVVAVVGYQGVRRSWKPGDPVPGGYTSRNAELWKQTN